MKRTRRTSMELIIEILNTCNNCTLNKTKIINKTNLNSKIGSDYINFLINKKYLVHKGDKYQTSEIGKRLLNKINEMDILTLNFPRDKL